MNILLLEDNATDASLVVDTLKKQMPGCEIEHVTTLQKARELISRRHSFDIALLDMKLPDGSGMDLLIEIRQKHMDMAVAMLTGSGDEDVATAALKAGADDYMVKKPGYVSKILQLVEFAIENYNSILRRESNCIQILHIEHNAADVDLTSRHLARYAPYIKIKNVPSGEAALNVLPDKETEPENWEYQLVLMDYLLPGMTALEIIKEIRQERKLDIPIVIVTGHGNEDVAVQALKMGANEYLVKRDNYLTRLPSLISTAYEHCELKRKQKALIESEAKYRLLAENSDDVIFTLDFDLNYTYISPTVQALLGFTIEEVLNRKTLEALTPASYKMVMEIIERELPEISSGNVLIKPTVLELEMYKKDGTTIWVEVKVSISRDSKGNPVGILGVSRDISKRKAIEQDLKKLSRAVTQSPDSIVIADVNGKIEYVNPKFTELTGYHLSEVIGQNSRILKSGEHSISFYKELWDTITSGLDWYGEFHNRKKNGELYWERASISGLADEDGKITHFVAVKEDITKKKKLLEELVAAKEKAEESGKLKTAFINNISHEIRTPLNGILGFGQILVESDLPIEKRAKMLNILQQSSARLMHTISDYMNMARIVSSDMQVHKKELHLQPFFEKILEDTKQVCAGNEIDFKTEIPDKSFDLSVFSDPELIQIILTKLLDNAVKFTHQGIITCGYLIKSDNIEFFVSDTGSGIASDKLDVIFQMFTQGDLGMTRGYEGSGLGLTIAKGLVTLLGGDMTVSSETEKGSTFTFTIPMNDSGNSEKKGLPKEAELRNDIQPLVLIAEDDGLNYEYFAAVLDSSGYRHIHVVDGAAAVNMCKQHPEISIILMDIKMPVMNGVEATKLIREFRPELPIIATTAYAQAGDEHRFLSAGCNDYLAKPIRAGELLAMIKKYNKPVVNNEMNQ